MSLTEIQGSKTAEWQALVKVLNFPFRAESQLGSELPQFNFALRCDTFSEYNANIIRNPTIFYDVLQACNSLMGIEPSYGLRVRMGSSRKYVHWLYELDGETTIGTFFFDRDRPFNTTKIHQIEMLINHLGIQGAWVIANTIGKTALTELERINKEYGRALIVLESTESLLSKVDAE